MDTKTTLINKENKTRKSEYASYRYG